MIAVSAIVTEVPPETTNLDAIDAAVSSSGSLNENLAAPVASYETPANVERVVSSTETNALYSPTFPPTVDSTLSLTTSKAYEPFQIVEETRVNVLPSALK